MAPFCSPFVFFEKSAENQKTKGRAKRHHKRRVAKYRNKNKKNLKIEKVKIERGGEKIEKTEKNEAKCWKSEFLKVCFIFSGANPHQNPKKLKKIELKLNQNRKIDIEIC